MMKMNEARKMNNKAVVEETERMTDPLYEKRRNKEEYQNDKKQIQNLLQEKGLSKDKTYVYDTAGQADKTSKKKKKNITFGWDVFNDDTLYKAYFKRVKKIDKDDKQEMTEQEKAEMLA